MARPKKQINRKQDIINAAQIIFTKKGYEKTAIEDIAKHVGISKTSVYLDFNNKEDILNAIIERNAVLLLSEMSKHIEDAKKPYLEDLKNLLHSNVLHIFDMATAHFRTYITLLLTNYKHKTENDFIIQKWYECIANMLQMAAKNGEITPLNDYKRLAQIISVSLQGFLPPYDLKYSPEHRADLHIDEIRKLLSNDVSIILDIIINGLKTAQYASEIL